MGWPRRAVPVAEPGGSPRRHTRVTRRLLVILTTTALLLSGCARSTTIAAAAPASSPSPVLDRTGEVYLAVLQRYLGTPTDNSFGVWNDKPVYVLDRAYPSAADPA